VEEVREVAGEALRVAAEVAPQPDQVLVELADSSRLQNKTNAPDKIAESGHKGVVVELEF
jgi:hypothetical protein